MQFTGKNTTEWITKPNPNHIRHASYDLSIAKVIVDGNELKPLGRSKRFKIEPQQVFVVISEETVSVPRRGVSCYAFPKTSLCKTGLLALNTGIVDPGYEGLISTTAINFHSEPLVLSVGEAFLRLAFFETQDDVCSKLVSVDDADYLAERLAESAELPASFLDVPRSVERLIDKLKDGFSQVHYKAITILVAVLALVVTIVVSLSPVVTPIAMEKLGLYTSDATQNKQLSDLRKQLDDLEIQVEQLETAIHHPSPP